MQKKYYITAAIPYVNARPHVGHALEFVQTDTVARFHKLLGDDVCTLSGGDENALKNVQAAESANEPVQDFVDNNTNSFFELTSKLNCQFDIWQKGSDKKHHKASQRLWGLVKENNPDDIYEKEYEGLYCVGCEAFYTQDELNEKGVCSEHPGKPLEKVKEKNYFFRLSKYQKRLIEIIDKEEIKIWPGHRKNEVLQFIKQGLEDISISRSNERAKNWGVPVPGDDTQRMYVWFDALNIYQSGVGFGWDEEKYNKYWPADLHVIGKGILRFHAIYWPAFLLSANLKLPKAIFVHDYFTVNGQKMSKSVGNVVDPIEMINKYGADALRYYFLAKFSPFNDGDFSEEKLKEVYNADLANGLGNLVARVAKLAENNSLNAKTVIYHDEIYPDVFKSFSNFRYDNALTSIWERVKRLDTLINKVKLWENTKDKLNILEECVEEILWIAYNLRPFLPETAHKITKQFSQKKIISADPLFPRIK
ncbi:methionine--tRNA ligase [Candidatus Microgenomates bacterium]|nr:MAG: methionine--tRNA ligase [Candidatus Microgenomates bacterium]